MNSTKIDVNYSQTGNVCVFASYSIIMNYFSKRRNNISDLIYCYVQIFQTNPVNNTALEIENSIHKHYHSYCQGKNLRGFQFIANCHNGNMFSTLRFCVPVKVAVNIGHSALSRRHNTTLKKRLRKGGLAMVLTDNGNHAIVVGFDKRKKGYFYRNPTRYNDQVLVKQDILNINDIFEYILFERRKKQT